MNEILINALRYCADNEKQEECDECPYLYNGMCRTMLSDAAYTLEAAEKRIAELEAQAEALKEESEAYKFGYLDGKTESDRQIEDLQTALTDCRLRKGEAQLPKEGEWIDAYIGGNLHKRCPQCGTYIEATFFANDYDVNFCPNCGLRMRKGEQDG